MATLKDFSELKARLLAAYDRVAADDDLLPIDGVDLSQLQERRQQLVDERFVVAVCGQIKGGKSTLLNALIFGRPVLPHDYTVMTAKNTTIERGETGLDVAFYDEAEWKELRERLARDLESKRAFDEELERCAQRGVYEEEYVRTPRRAASSTDLGQLNKFATPVEKGGVVAPFVKQITVRFNHAWTTEAVVADTPGTEDPNPIRDGLTKRWIQNADAVIYVCYAGAALQAADVAFIDRYLLHVPDNRRVLAVNKADVLEDPKVVEDWLFSLRDGSPRMSAIIPEHGVILVSALGGLLDRMLADDCQLSSDHQEDAERLDESGWLDASKHRIPELAELVENRLMSNKGAALIATSRGFLESIFERHHRALEDAIEADNENLELLGKTHEELEAERTLIRRERNKVADKFRDLKAELDKRLDDWKSELAEGLEEIEQEIARSCEQGLRKIEEIEHFKDEVPWLVVRAFNGGRASIRRLLDGKRKEMEDLFLDALTELKKDLGENALSFSRADALLDLNAFDTLQTLKTSLHESFSTSAVDGCVAESTNFLQRWFNTEGGRLDARTRLTATINSAFESGFSDVLINAVSRRTRELASGVFDRLQTAVNEALEQRDATARQLLANQEDLEAQRSAAKSRVAEGQTRMQEIAAIRTDVMNGLG